MRPAEKLLHRLKGVRVTGERRWQALCPAHDDRNPSLSISERPNGDLLVHDHVGCDVDAVLAAAEFEKRDLFAESANSHPETEAIYSYVDEDGEPLFEVVRFAGKQFRQRRPDGTWKLNGVRRVVYRLPRVLEAVGRGDS